jgi:hypothetical protein
MVVQLEFVFLFASLETFEAHLHDEMRRIVQRWGAVTKFIETLVEVVAYLVEAGLAVAAKQ